MRKISERLAVVGLVVTTLGVIVAVLDWRFPVGGQVPPASTTPSATVPAVTSPDAPAGGSPAATRIEYLSALPAHAGTANLTELPRELRETAEFQRAIVIKCPSNQSNDKVSEVAYQLFGRFDTFQATVRPHFDSQPDARMHVEVLVGERARDGRLVWDVGGGQYEATAVQPGSLNAVVEGMQELKIQVRCELPDGVAILVDAALYE
ncbi:hypothetical protein O7608_22985 [Solwaraspora sp. WMMA2056]|uniref:hypothetical protein n=1 Tax=Solwaraspora sp. WMMA2056 TaxID=3015161 RepID=UPI00259B4DD2|nr:hypothetical protein [Solwaraspora sp. WMMA2056]WJK39308.1 hypothetical protein O7608_22985 [Solwaraspora sp. WMMA2056]